MALTTNRGQIEGLDDNELPQQFEIESLANKVLAQLAGLNAFAAERVLNVAKNMLTAHSYVVSPLVDTLNPQN